MKYTIIIAGICILFFLVQNIVPGFTEALLLNQQAFSQPWRFVTSIFLHGSPEHLLLNLFALVMFGLILEKFVKSKVMWIFLLAGILANIVSVFFYDSSLGASGAIFGIIGALVILKPKMVVWTYGMPLPMFLAVVVWAAIDILGVFNPSGTGNIAHLSGLAVGLLFGIFLRTGIPRESEIRRERILIDENSMRKWEDNYMR